MASAIQEKREETMVNRRDFGKISLAAGLAATLGRPAWAASAADTAVKAAVCTENLSAGVAVVKSAQDGA